MIYWGIFNNFFLLFKRKACILKLGYFCDYQTWEVPIIMLEIIYVQSNTTHPAGFQYLVDKSNDWWLLTMTNTPAYYIVEGKRIVMPTHTIALYPPYSSIEYGSLENEIFCDDWMRFYTDEPFICNGHVPFGIPFKALDHSYISSLIHLLAVENFFQNQYRNFTIQSLFQILFAKLRESLSYKSGDFREMALQQLHMNIASNPSSPWNIPDMANQLHISPRHLQKLYQKRYGISCMEDVIEHRLLLAKEKLSSTTLPIYKIAEQCGYSNTEHFSRQFKNKFALSPKAFRESSRNK